jgi:hypothetical protein
MTRLAFLRRGPRKLGVATATLMLACGGEPFTTGGGTDGLGATAGDGGSSTGGSSTGGASAGGSFSGGAPATGGTGGGARCTTDLDCDQPGAPCSAAHCVSGQCVIQYTDGCGIGGSTGAQCMEANDCPPPPPGCEACPDGTTVCAGVDCIGGHCVLTGTCPPAEFSCPGEVPVGGTLCTRPLDDNTGFSSDVAHCSWGPQRLQLRHLR